MKKYKIYTLSHPITNDIKYIGCTYQDIKKRRKGHISSARSRTRHNKKLFPSNIWVKSLLDNGLRPNIEILEEVENGFYWEVYYISLFKSWGFDLVNKTEGGNDMSKINSPKELKRRHNLWSGENNPKHNSKRFGELNPFYGKKHSDESLLKIRNVVLQYDSNKNFLKRYISLTEASKQTKISISVISNICNGKTKHPRCGFLFFFEHIILEIHTKIPNKID